MRLSWDGTKFVFQGTYNDRFIPKDAGFFWSVQEKHWYTYKWEIAKKLSKWADQKCVDKLNSYQTSTNKSVLASHATDSMVDIPVPDGMSYLPYQKAGMVYALERPDNLGALIADEMGLGKTIQAIGYINAKPEIKSVLVVCPASIKINWSRELTKWLVRSLKVKVIGSQSQSSDIKDADVAIINYDILKKFQKLYDTKYDLVIVDECHYVKNHKAIRSKAVYKIMANAKYKLMLTGTPIMNRPVEIYPLITSLGVRIKFWTFAKKYCNPVQTGFGWDLSGASNLEELGRYLRTTVMVRRLKSEVLKELPPKRWQIIELPANGLSLQLQKEDGMWDKYTSMRETLEVLRNEAEYADEVHKLNAEVELLFEEMSKTRHETALLKVPYVINHIDNLLENVDKLVVFAHHKDVIEQLAKHYDGISVVVSGSTKLEDRQANVDAFQHNPDIRLFIGSIGAAGVGITLTAASTVLFVELDWVPANMSQAEDRVHRIGQEESVLVQHIVIDGSIDSYLAHTLVAKQKVISESLNTKHVVDAKEVKYAGKDSDVSKPVEHVKKAISDDEKAVLHHALRLVAGQCDGAMSEDGVGFNGWDTAFGRQVAFQPCITTDAQARAVKALLKKYKRQLEIHEQGLWDKIYNKETK
jgi:SWI/SNF-related matrix-associated actin-dependent regulator of chromatin subfamily A-like protein 1